MRILIITNNVPPIKCGIGDYVYKLKQSLEYQNEYVDVIAFKGDPSKHTYLFKSVDMYNDKMLSFIKQMKYDHVLMQYTPLMYKGNIFHYNNKLIQFWNKCVRITNCSMMIHETYNYNISRPISFLRGEIEKRMILVLAAHSHYIFSSPKTLTIELLRRFKNKKVSHFSICSNITPLQINRNKAKGSLGLDSTNFYIALFGSENAISKNLIVNVEQIITSLGLQIEWILLGGIKGNNIKFKSRYYEVDYQPEEIISRWLTASDILLMPHTDGVSFKRGTLMAALEHGLPILGTIGKYTDTELFTMKGIKLFTINDYKNIAGFLVLLSRDKELWREMGKCNKQYYRDNLDIFISCGKILKVLNEK